MANRTSLYSILAGGRTDTFFTSIITEDDIDAQLMSSRGGSPPLDILIRTSGVNRLSDFLLWQVCIHRVRPPTFPISAVQCCENTQLHFSPTYWPEYGLLDFIPVILDYQKKVWQTKRVPP
jgi:ditrans,polycis-polyprenyl diphosphate synthase